MDRDQGQDTKVCRICLDRSRVDGLISACNCAGHVHRKCLDKERINTSRPVSIYNCEKCGTDYRLLPKEDNETFSQRWRRSKFHALVLRDFFVVFCLIQITIMMLGFLISLIDKSAARCMPSCQVESTTESEECTKCPPIQAVLFPRSMEDHSRVTYYVCGLILFLAIVGIFGICNQCFECIIAPSPHPVEFSVVNHHHYRGGPYRGDCCFECYRCIDCHCCCDGCDCHNPRSTNDDCCKCETSDQNSSGVAFIIILIAIVIVMFAVLGVFYGIVAATALFQKIVQRHIHTLELTLLAHDYPVADLADEEEDIPFAEVASGTLDVL